MPAPNATGWASSAIVPPAPSVAGVDGTEFAANPNDRAAYASWIQRVSGWFIDLVLVLILCAAMAGGAALLGKAIGPEIGAEYAATIAAAAAGLVSAVYFLTGDASRSGQTIGRKAVGIRVVRDPSGAPLGFWRAVGRWIARIFSAIPLYLGYLAPMWDRKRRTFHDSIASTVVIRDPTPRRAGAPLALAFVSASLLAVGSGLIGAEMAKSDSNYDYPASDYDTSSYDDGAETYCDDTLRGDLVAVTTDGTNLYFSVVVHADQCMAGTSIGSDQEIGISWYENDEEMPCLRSYSLNDPTLDGETTRFNFTMRGCAPTVGSPAALNWPGVQDDSDGMATVEYGSVLINNDSTTTTTWDSTSGDASSSEFPSTSTPDSGSGSSPTVVDDGAEDTAGSDLGPSVTFADQQQQAAASVIERFVQAYDEGDVATIRAIDPSKDDETVAELELPDAAAIQILGTSDFSETSPTTGASGYLVHGLYVVQKGSCEERYDVWWLVDEETDTVVQEHGIDGYKNTAIKEC